MDMIAAPKPYHISVFGLPHIGKTSFLIKLHEELSQEDGYLCVRVPAFVEGDFCNNMVNIIDAMAEEELDLDPIADGISDDADAQELIGALRQALQQVTRSGRRTVLLLDECTSALDAATEERLLNNLHSLQDRAVLLISHKNTTVAGSDHVWRLEDGKLIEI